MNRKTAFFSFFIVFLLFIVTEAILRIRENLKNKAELEYAQAPYFVPHHFLNYELNPKSLYHNSLGFRGQDILKHKEDGVYRIFCLGGSSVYGSKVAWNKSYPYFLNEILKEDFPNRRFEVINAGVPGYTSANLFIQFQFKILPLSPDMIIIYSGFNDIFPRLMGIDSPDYSSFNKTWQEVSVFRKILFSSLVCQKTVGRIGERLKLSFLTWPPHLHQLIQVRPYQYYLKDYKKNLAVTSSQIFERNILSLIQLAKANNVDVLLVTQALAPAKKRDALYEALGEGVRQHNSVMVRLAEREQIPLIELDRLFPPHEDMFCDDIHMSAKGNQLRAKIISEKIAQIINSNN
ncbi:MAG: SGNH/GDSL hydrolase family protein [Candidatus Omnitrophota bacterium]